MPLRIVQVDAVDRARLAEGLGEALGLDGGSRTHLFLRLSGGAELIGAGSTPLVARGSSPFQETVRPTSEACAATFRAKSAKSRA